MGRVVELKREAGERQAALLNEISTLAQRGRQTDLMSKTAKDRLGPALKNETAEALHLAEGEAFVESERQRLKSEYLKIDAELREQIQQARIAATQELAPSQASPDPVLRASTMTEEQVVAAMDAAASLGEAGTDTIRLLLTTSMQKDGYELAVQHALSLLPELEDAYQDVVEADETPDFEDAAQRFEVLSQPDIDRQRKILSGPERMSDIDAYGQMLG